MRFMGSEGPLRVAKGIDKLPRSQYDLPHDQADPVPARPASSRPLNELPMAFAPTIPVPSALPPSLAGAALLADRVEGLLPRLCDSHPDENPELLIRAARAIWNLTAVRKTIYLLTNPGADRRHRRGKSDATMTYIEHRVSELHDWVAEYQRLVRAMKKDPTQFTRLFTSSCGPRTFLRRPDRGPALRGGNRSH